MSWTLDYDGEGLLLRVPPEQTDEFQASGFYKLSLKRYVSRVQPGCITFHSSLTYLDYKKIIFICQRHSNDFVVSNTLVEYIDAKEIYVEKRSRLGIELKNHESKLQERYEQYKMVVDDAMIRPLRDRQMWDSFYLCAMQKAANFSVPGSGKTASVLGMYAYLRNKGLINRLLVICPKNAFGSWIDEFSACFGEKDPLRVLNIHESCYKTTVERKNALRFDAGRCNLILVNYETLGGVKEALQDLLNYETMLVFDEVHKVKRVSGKHANHALEIAKKASYVVAMTGTPIPNTYLDVYNLLHLLFPDEYDTFFDFSIPVLRNPTSQDIQDVNDKLQPFFCRTTKDQLGVPPANPDSVYGFPATNAENRIMNILKAKYKQNKLALLIRLLQLESNPRMLLQCLNLRDFQYILDDSVDVDEIDFVDYSEEIKDLIINCETATKFEHCIELAKSLVAQKKTVIIWCIFVDTLQRLGNALHENGIQTRCIYGELPLEQRQELLEEFRNGQVQVLLTNPHTLAESVSLHNVCHDAIYFEYSYNLIHLLQSKDRIHRLGLPDNQYTQYHFLQLSYQTTEGTWSLDDAVYQRLKEKEQTMLNAIDHHVLETMPTNDEDLEMIFKNLF